jgi:hypothetical protein
MVMPRVDPRDPRNYIPEPNSGCWLWLREVDRDGYAVYDRGKRVARLVCSAEDGELACHHCDVPSCINPTHVYRGTAKSNADDMLRRGRHKGGRRSKRDDPNSIWWSPWVGYH